MPGLPDDADCLEAIRRSHARCAKFGLAARQPGRARPPRQGHPRLLRAAHANLLTAARPILGQAIRALRPWDLVFVLVSADLRLLAVEGCPTAIGLLAEAGLTLGARLDESRLGTNGWDLALRDGATRYVVGPDHLLGALQSLITAAVPVEIDGRPVGAVGIAGPASRAAELPAAIALCQVAAQAVSQALLLGAQNENLLLLSEILAEPTSSAVIVLDGRMRIRRAGPQVRRVLGLDADPTGNLIRSLLRRRTDPETFDRAVDLVAEAVKTGERREFEITIATPHLATPRATIAVEALPISVEGQSGGVLLLCRDVTAQRLRQEELELRARTDSLTGLFNHYHFQEYLTESIRESERTGRPVSLLFIDLDNFKSFNEMFGHLHADELLREVAGLLHFHAPSFMVARYGGDEFAVVCRGIGASEAALVAERLRQAVEQSPFLGVWTSPEGRLTVSIGVATYPDHAASDADLVAAADRALLEGKATAKNAVFVRDSGVRVTEQPAATVHDQRHAFQIVLSLAKIEELKDRYVRGHSERMLRYAGQLARALGTLSPEQIREIEFGAMLHDIGKIAVPSRILHKRGPLTDEEWRVMRSHPEIGATILRDLELLHGVEPLVRHHHERWDGRISGPNPGYPDGKKGERIPLGARIIAVVDAYDAMTTDRPYRKARTSEEALAELAAAAGSQFDPNLVEVFSRLVREGAFAAGAQAAVASEQE